MTATLCVFSASVGVFPPFGMSFSFHFENHVLVSSLTPSSTRLLAQSKYPIQQKLLVFKSSCAAEKQKFLLCFLFFPPPQSFDFFIQDLTLV